MQLPLSILTSKSNYPYKTDQKGKTTFINFGYMETCGFSDADDHKFAGSTSFMLLQAGGNLKKKMKILWVNISNRLKNGQVERKIIKINFIFKIYVVWLIHFLNKYQI